MSNKLYDLDQILDLPRWQALQDQLADMMNMAIITVDYKGVPITRHSGCCPFCQSVRGNPQLEKYCQTCDSRGGLEAVRQKKPFVYLCHFNIIDIAIPITVDDKYLGAVMAGQVKPVDPARIESFEHLLSSGKNAAAAQHLQVHQREYDAIPTLRLERILQESQTLFDLCNYIVESAMRKNQIIQAYEALYQNAQQLAVYPHTAQEITQERTKNYLEVRPSGHVRSEVSVLAPAIRYIDENPRENVMLSQMAELCHLSQSYFSRLFTQETGETFSNYTARRKVERARELLESTEESVEKISEQLGFNSAGYFIKVFKKHEGITPLLYRSYYKKANGIQQMHNP